MTNEFEQLLKECLELHNKKAADYSSDSDKYSNFKVAAYLVSLFKNPIDQVFACMIGIKLARKAELSNGKIPNNESLRDTGLDLVNYAALWQSYYDSLDKEDYINSMDLTPIKCNICNNYSCEDLMQMEIHLLYAHPEIYEMRNKNDNL